MYFNTDDAVPEEGYAGYFERYDGLAGVDLTGADLRHARLAEVDLTGASLTGAVATNASLRIVMA